MALLNYLFNGSYSSIDSCTYSKRNNMLHVDINVYKDSSKKELICYRSLDFGGQAIPSISNSTLEDFPKEPSAYATTGEGFITAPNGCIGKWINRDRLYAVKTVENGGNNDWEFWTLGGRDIFFHELTGKYVHLKSDYSLRPIEYTLDYRVWKTWFDFSDSNMNMIKQVYNFIKTNVASFENCVDG